MTAPLPLLFEWDRANPPPRLALRLSNRRPILVPPVPSSIDTGPAGRPFDFSAAMSRLAGDIAAKCPALSHVDPARMLFTIFRARNGARHGLQARLTPLRFEGGTPSKLRRGRKSTIQRFRIDGVEILYLISFCLPRFSNRPYHEQLATVVHELQHVGPAFDGDLRRHAGRCVAHSHDAKAYDRRVAELTSEYLANGADASTSDFLHLRFAQLCRRHGSVTGFHPPRPKVVSMPA